MYVCVYICSESYSATKMSEMMPFAATWRGLEMSH